MWAANNYRCMVCGGTTQTNTFTNEGTVLESTSKCDDCKFWCREYEYGNEYEQIGLVSFSWHYHETKIANLRRRQEQLTALREIVEALKFDEFNALAKTINPVGILADWLEDNGFLLQAEGARQYDVLHVGVWI